MPVTNGIGHSDYTPLKHDHLAGILKMHMEICRGIDARGWLAHWWYFDLNAGNGSGSPAVAWRVLHTVQPPYAWRVVLIEKNAATYASLARQFDGLPGVACRNSDNRAVVNEYARILCRSDYGIVFHDPNGGEIDLEMLRAFRDTRLDVLVYYSAAGNKRLAAAFRDHRGIRLGQIVAEDVKKHWLIRKPEGRHQWTLLIGSNWVNFPTWERQGFYRLHSAAGQEIFDRLHYTSNERAARQPQLDGFEPPYRSYAEYLQHPTFKAIRAQVMARAGGICERCHARPATEPHHLRYPKWGTFDVPENLIAVCHPCHCEIHGKER